MTPVPLPLPSANPSSGGSAPTRDCAWRPRYLDERGARHVARAPRPGTPGTARLGDLRLGELRLPDARSSRRCFPSTTTTSRPRGLAAEDGRVQLQHGDDRRAGHHRGDRAGARRDRRSPPVQEAVARRLHGDRRRWPRWPWRRSARATGRWRSGCSWSPTSASAGRSCSTTRCCRTSRAPTRWTASRSPATRSATSAAACCCALNLAWILKPRLVRPGRRRRGDAPLVPQRRRLVGRVLDPAVPPRARAGTSAGGGHGAIGRRRGMRLADLRETFRDLRKYRQAFLMLLAFLIYNDGIGTIIRMASLYGAADRASPQDAPHRRARAGAVRRHPVRVRVRRARRPHRRQARDLPRARRLHGHQHARLLHDRRPCTSSCWRSWWARCRAAARRCRARCSRA